MIFMTKNKDLIKNNVLLNIFLFIYFILKILFKNFNFIRFFNDIFILLFKKIKKIKKKIIIKI